MPHTFISYRRDDAAGYAGRLHESLEERLGADQIFRDIDTLRPGQDFVQVIEDRLRECRVVLALIGREWLDSRDPDGRRRLDQPHDFVRLEIAGALPRRDVLVVPVLIEGAAMPSPESLPDDLRPLARRHAVRLRDDAWDHDVDRLATVVRGAGGRPRDTDAGQPAASAPWPRLRPQWLAIGAVILLVAALAWLNAGPRGSAGRAGAGDALSSQGQPYGVSIPRVSEVAHTALLYTLLSGTVVPLGDGTSEMRLRFRFSNEGRYDANAGAASFRLVAGGDMLAPTSPLNEIVPGHSLRQGVITFDVPAQTGRAMLRIIEGDRLAEIPLDLSPTRRPAEDEHADAGDALSRAIITTILEEPRVLVRDASLTVTATRGTSRRFANVVRVRFALRFSNGGNYPAHSGAMVLRVAAGDQVLPPIEPPNVVVEAQSTSSADVAFELPAAVTRAVLRARIGDRTSEWTFDVP